MKPFYFYAPHELHFGKGVSDKIGAICRELGASRVTLVTSAGMPQLPFFDHIYNSLKEAGVRYDIFDRVSPEPPVRDLENCVRFARENQAELIVGLGGGSAMDVAKTSAVLLKNGGTVYDYFGMHKIPRHGIPTVMLPTTSGTGSEVTPNSVFIIEEEQIKRGIEDPHQIPNCALVDPDLSMTMPPELTAATGMDALTHAIESYVSKRSSPISEGFSLKAISLIVSSLSKAYKDGSDTEAREKMSLGSTLAGLAFGNAGTGGVHACAYPLSGRFMVPHGKANALMLPYVVEYNLSSTSKYENLKQYLGNDLPKALHDLVASTNLPTRLSEVGIQEEDIETMADKVIKIERHWAINPRRPKRDDIIKIYRKAL